MSSSTSKQPRSICRPSMPMEYTLPHPLHWIASEIQGASIPIAKKQLACGFNCGGLPLHDGHLEAEIDIWSPNFWCPSAPLPNRPDSACSGNTCGALRAPFRAHVPPCHHPAWPRITPNAKSAAQASCERFGECAPAALPLRGLRGWEC